MIVPPFDKLVAKALIFQGLKSILNALRLGLDIKAIHTISTLPFITEMVVKVLEASRPGKSFIRVLGLR